MANYTVMDISQWNVINDYAAAAKAVDAVIIRVGYRGYGNGGLALDSKFRQHIDNFSKYGVPLGIYFMSAAMNATEGAQEAAFTYNQIKNYKITLPVFIDSEYTNANATGRSDHLSKSQRTAALVGFCDQIKKFGYKPGVYSGDYWYRDNLDLSQLTKYNLWVASYGANIRFVSNYIGWQYTDKGRIAGVPNGVDLSHWYVSLGGSRTTPVNEAAKIKTEGNSYGLSSKNVILKSGSAGDDVKWLQTELNKYGYKLSVDGIFGNGTKNAVADYQKKHGLTADGEAGPLTINALISKKAAVKTNTSTAKPASKPAAKPATKTVAKNPYVLSSMYAIIKQGQSGSNVKWLQFELNRHGYKLAEDGIFGSGTKNAVADYQKKHGLSVDGIAGHNTIQYLADHRA